MESERWFHDRNAIGSREDAEQVLRLHGFVEGVFLVRESTTASGDFVLSVVHNNEVIHYQIRKRGDDAIFSLAEVPEVIHGLDELIHYYKTNPNSGLQHPLTEFVEGELCPVGVRLHGTENLLHRASAGGDATVVSELLKCGYRNLAAKNHDGQSATHLAAYFGCEQVLRELIKHGANVNVTDTSGYTPLHFAAQANQSGAMKVLLELGHASPVTRNLITGWIPLHEAAWKGHVECVEVLLNYHSPIRPRTPKNETPLDLARSSGHSDVAKLIDSYVLPEANLSETDFLHVMIRREEAIVHLNDGNKGDGTFLVRRSAKKSNVYVLSMLYDMQSHHFEIVKQGIYFFLEKGPYHSSLCHLVQHYFNFPDGLPCRLQHPVAPKHDKIPPRVPLRHRNQAYPSNLKSIEKKKTYENHDTLRRVRHSKDNVPVEKITFGTVIGEGEFGAVYEGTYVDEDDNLKQVAVKVLHTMEEDQKREFLREAELMMKLDHQCVVQLLGITKGSQIIMLLELIPQGSMLSYLHDHPDSVRTEMELPLWSGQIACGMSYLANKHFIHRDLAARNILLASKFQAKISDFGLSRHVEEKNYYRASKGGRWPIKWYAPECVNFGTFSSASDVWSYGVLLWEMYSYGQQPYDGKTGMETVKFIEDGNRLPRPERADLEIYSTMQWCWEYIPENRPDFKELFKIFAENPDYLNLKELLKIQDLKELGM